MATLEEILKLVEPWGQFSNWNEFEPAKFRHSQFHRVSCECLLEETGFRFFIRFSKGEFPCRSFIPQQHGLA